MEFFRKKTSFDFVGRRRYAYALSGALCALGVVAFILIATGRGNLGIEFAGGTAIQLRFERPVGIGAARSVAEQAGFRGAELQQISEGNRLLIRVKRTDLPPAEISKALLEGFRRQFPDNRFEVESTTEIGPAVGEKLRRDAAIAILLSFVGIIIYIAARFQFKFGVAATIATFHDVLVVLGILFILNKEITLLIVTALLTLAGYSLTDTVVVFDRIRENQRLNPRGLLATLINLSVNETLSRTLITGLSAIFTILALLFLGGEVIRDFALALFLGVIVGTYSSIFVASPVVLAWPGGKGRAAGRRA
ncbi:MAG: protein translocase subunit SecF [Deltaproteobacteria bacterium]|nr:protein translocase subunit SecF [Deltaproteobacteria bacterium]MBI3077954.1 protein translocase subunit SecF [Deltaproteobacteria bacterium]